MRKRAFHGNTKSLEEDRNKTSTMDLKLGEKKGKIGTGKEGVGT